MTFEVATGSFDKTAGPDIINLTFEPKAVVVWTSKSADGVLSNDALLGIGCTDGVNHGCVYYVSEDNGAKSDSDHFLSTVRTIAFQAPGVNPASTSDEGTVTFSGSSFILTWNKDSGGSERIFWKAYGGDDVTGAFVGAFTNPLVTGPHDIDPGFLPDGLMVLHAGHADVGAKKSGAIGVGFGARDAGQGAYSVFSQNNSNDMITRRYQVQNRIAVMANSFGLLESGELRPSLEWVGTSFRINWTGAGVAINHVYLALQGPQFYVGSETEVANTGPQTLVGFGLAPASMLFAGAGAPPSAGISLDGQACFGAATAVAQGAAGIHDQNGTQVANTLRKSDSGVCMLQIESAPSERVVSSAVLTSLDGNGATLQMTKLDTIEREFFFLAAAATPGILPQFVLVESVAPEESLGPVGATASGEASVSVESVGPEESLGPVGVAASGSAFVAVESVGPEESLGPVTAQITENAQSVQVESVGPEESLGPVTAEITGPQTIPVESVGPQESLGPVSATISGADQWMVHDDTERLIDPDDHGANVLFLLEISLASSVGVGFPAKARLTRKIGVSWAEVAGSRVQTEFPMPANPGLLDTIYARVRSPTGFTLPSGPNEYRIEVGGRPGAHYAGDDSGLYAQVAA